MRLVARSIAGLLLLGCVPSSATAQQEETPEEAETSTDVRKLETYRPPPTPFEDLVEEALAEHPRLETLRADVEVESARIDGTGIKPDPTVSLAAEGLQWKDPRLSSHPMSGIQLSVMQPLWWPGELESMKQTIRRRKRALKPRIDEERIQLIHRAAGLYYEVYRIDRTIESLEEQKEPVREFLKLLKSRIPTGKATVAQVERTKLELMRIDDRILKLRHRRPMKVARLNAVLNRPAGSPVNPPPEGTTEGLDAKTEQPLGPLDELVERGMESRPVVEFYERRVEVAKARAATAKWEKYPDLSVFGGWRFRAAQRNSADDGTDFFGIGVQSTLPIWSPAKANSAVDASNAETVRWRRSIDAFRLQLRGEIQGHLTKLHHFFGHLDFYNDELIPQAKRTRETALSGFAAGNAGYEDWIQAERTVVQLQTRVVELRASIRRERAMALALIGDLTEETSSEATNEAKP